MLAAAVWASPAFADELRASLDSTLASGDLRQLAAIVQAHTDLNDQARIAHWIEEKVENGQAPDSLARAMIAISLRSGSKDDALMYLSYYRALISLDGFGCSDQSSGGSLFEATIFLFGRLTRDPTVSVERKKVAVDRALKLEERTASERRTDPALCQSGLTAYAKSMNLPPANKPEPSDRSGQEAPLAPRLPYASDPNWRGHRSASLPQLKALLLTLGGVPPGD